MLATVVRYYGGIQLGAGGLVRAYTDSVAQALLQADKVPVVRWRHLRFVLPYALEGWLRRELDAHGAQLDGVLHGEGVEATVRLPDAQAAPFVARLNNAAQGQVMWLEGSPDGGAA